MDVTSAESVNAAVSCVLARTGRIDVLVNNAGIAGRAAPLCEQTEEDWRRIIAVNMDSVFHTCRAVLPHMRERKYGRIVNLASIAGKEGNPNMTGYSATKAAVIAFTKSVAKEVATEGITVNSVAPAVVRTRILDQLTPAQVAYMTEKIPMRRTGKPEEIAAVVHTADQGHLPAVQGQLVERHSGLLGLGLGALDRDDDITQVQAAIPFTLLLGEGYHVRGPVAPQILLVQTPDVTVVHEDHGKLGLVAAQLHEHGLGPPADQCLVKHDPFLHVLNVDDDHSPPRS